MFAYCGNNPITRTDESGQIWKTIATAVAIVVTVAATVNDIYQLCRDDSEKIEANMTESGGSVQISNSTNVVTPWVQLGYSVYLNHFSEYSDYFTGTSAGMAFEWLIHNIGYYAFDLLEDVADFVGLDATNINSYKSSCSEADLGATIYDDKGTGARGAMSLAMKGLYVIASPFTAVCDAVAHYLD